MSRLDPTRLSIARGCANRGEGFSYWDYLAGRGDGPEVGLAYAHAFWPALIQVRGFVLIEEHYDEEYFDRVLRDYGEEQVEATINTTYLQDIFGPVAAADAVWEELGRLTCEMWRAHAERQFQGRRFAADFAWYSDIGDPGVTLYTVGK